MANAKDSEAKPIAKHIQLNLIILSHSSGWPVTVYAIIKYDKPKIN